jgi:flagellar biosynthesis protein FlhA
MKWKGLRDLAGLTAGPKNRSRDTSKGRFMATAVTQSRVGRLGLSRIKDLVLPLGIIASVLVILVPLPPAVLDMLLSLNITVSVIILLTTIYVRTPLEFNIFPSLLLASTLARLVLNVATTRLVLTRAGEDGSLAAGHVVKAFGEFVAGNDLVVGIIIFVIIIVIQFIVITKGATRISEVAARFALDGMPGRQMAIDADLNAGTIDELEAQRRRQEITRQADFFGAMDGASKFVRGDAIAAILITLINIVGGLTIGVLEFGMSVSEAMHVFTQLTIGDGLVSQVPAFLISLAAGLLVTRSSYEVNLPSEFVQQLFSRPQPADVPAATDWRELLWHRHADQASEQARGGCSGGEGRDRSQEAARRTYRRLPDDRPDGDRDWRGADSPGRSETGRRLA